MLKSLLFYGIEFQVITRASIGIAKKFLLFLSKNKKRIFHFHQKLYWTTYSLFHYSLPFSGNFIISSSQNFNLFEQRTVQVPFTIFQGLEIFSLREFSKFLGAMSGEYGRWIRTSQPSCNSFCLIIRETLGLVLILLEDNGFYVD